MLFAALLAASVISPMAPDARERAKNRAAELVAELASPSFRARENASDELVKLGSAALDALRKGMGHPDTEVAERCRRLLPQALDSHLREQIEVFLARPDGPIPEDLPGIRRWVAIAGKGKESRELYAQLVKGQRRLLIDIEADPQLAGHRYRTFCREVYDRTRGVAASGRPEAVTQPELLLFLFLGADPAVRKAGATSSIIYSQASIFLSSTHLPAMLSGSGASEASKKLFLAWLGQERYLTLVRRGYQLAANADLKEAAPLAVRTASDKTIPASARGYALTAAMKLFGEEHLKDLEGLMQDKTIVGITTLNGGRMTAEVRDIALGVAVLATGQQPADYGFERFRVNANPNFVSTSYLYFAMTDKQRDEAQQKWKEWREKHKK